MQRQRDAGGEGGGGGRGGRGGRGRQGVEVEAAVHVGVARVRREQVAVAAAQPLTHHWNNAIL